MLLGLSTIQTGWPHGTRGPKWQEGLSRSIKMLRGDPSADRKIIHPLVRRHPDSDRAALFVNPVYTQRIAGMDKAESAPILHFLYGYAIKPEFTSRLRWHPGAVG